MLKFVVQCFLVVASLLIPGLWACGSYKMAKANDKIIQLAEWSVVQFVKEVNGYQTAELQRIRNIDVFEVIFTYSKFFL